MKQLSSEQFEPILKAVGDTPFTVTPFFFLQRRACDVYADRAEGPRFGVIIPQTTRPDVYTFGVASLAGEEIELLADFLAGLGPISGYVVPIDLVAPIRSRRRIRFDVEGLCFSYRQNPEDFGVWRPELVRRLELADIAQVEGLPRDASFLLQNYDSPRDLLSEGLAFGVFRKDRLVSIAASLVCTPKHCDVGAFTRRRFRSRGYATDCIQATFAHLMDGGLRPLWRIGVRQKIAIYLAEKLEMDEIGTDGQEVYLQV